VSRPNRIVMGKQKSHWHYKHLGAGWGPGEQSKCKLCQGNKPPLRGVRRLPAKPHRRHKHKFVSDAAGNCVVCGVYYANHRLLPGDDAPFALTGMQPTKPERPEAVDHPAHYGGKDDPYEAIKVIEAWELGFCLGNVVKYLSRADKKGAPLEDLRKAAWYLQREIKRRTDGRKEE